MTAHSLKSTIKDVAKEANVSPMTVSRTLHQPDKVAPETRMRVLAACEQLNYRPNASARSLRTNRSHQVGVIIPDWRNPFWIDVVGGIEEVVTEAGFQLLIANSNEESDQQTLQIEAMLSRSIEGLVIAPSVGSASIIQALQQVVNRIVVIDRLPEGLQDVSCVTIDNEDGAYKATIHLIEEGHRRIGLLAGNVNLDTGQQRLNGYCRALRERSLVEDWDLIRTAGTNAALVGKQVGYQGTLEFLSQDDAPTAILCTSNTIAIGALIGLQECHVRIPEEFTWAGAHHDE
jgi:LacI family transcriptional regulator